MVTIKQLLLPIVNIIRMPFYAIKERQWRRKFGKYGNNTIVKRDSTLVPKNMYLDDYVIVQDKTNFISFNGKLIVKKYSVISSGCIIVPGAHKLKVGVPFYLATSEHIGDKEQDIIIEEDCWIGAGCILLPGIRIGRGSVVGAGSVVTKDIQPYTVVAGTPAKVIGVKFSLDDIIKHEERIYSKEERIKTERLNLLFSKYGDYRIMGDEKITDEEQILVNRFYKQVNLK